MKRLELAIFLLFLFFNIDNAVQISNGETIIVPKGKSEFTYQFLEPADAQGKVYFFFKFPAEIEITLTIRDEDKNEKIIESILNQAYYKSIMITNVKSQIYTFTIENKSIYSQTIHFIDNSREINSNLEEFLSFKPNIDRTENIIPLIFNLGLVTENITVVYEEDIEKYIINIT